MARASQSIRVTNEAETGERELSDVPEMPEAFCLPDGSALKYAKPDEPGDQYDWWRTWDAGFLYTWGGKCKEQGIRLGLWNGSGNLFVVAADFDKDPQEHGYASFDQLEAYLRFTYRDNAIVSRSFSNKVKCFFVVQSDSGEMNRDTAKETLHKILGPDLYAACDLSLPALSRTYLTATMARQLKRRLSSLTPIEAAVGNELERVRPDVNKVLTPPLPMRRESGPLSPELQKWVSRSPSSLSRLALMQILAASRKLLSGSGMDLPTTHFGKECGCHTMTISRYLKSLVDEGFLECTSKRYRPRHKAKTYRASGPLQEWLLAKFPKTTPPPDLSQVVIESGNWNDQIFRIGIQYGDLDAFRRDAAKLKGIDEKDRWRKVDTFIEQQKRKRKAYHLKAT